MPRHPRVPIPRTPMGGNPAAVFWNVILVALLAAIIAAAILLFAVPPAWFPAPISALASTFDAQFSRTLWVTGFGFLSIQVLLAIVIFRYRNRGKQPVLFRANWRLEVIWTSLIAFLFFGLALLGMPVFTPPQRGPEPPGAEIIEVDAHQFAWNFRYPGPDGKFGRTDLRLISDAGGNPLGRDLPAPSGKDDIVAATLRVPVNREIVLMLKSRDVIHDFFVRELRVKQAAVPGMNIPYRFRAAGTGVTEAV